MPSSVALGSTLKAPTAAPVNTLAGTLAGPGDQARGARAKPEVAALLLARGQRRTHSRPFHRRVACVRSDLLRHGREPGPSLLTVSWPVSWLEIAVALSSR